MLKRIIGLFVFILSLSLVNAQVALKKGMVISKSIKIKKANYELEGYDSLNKSAITIEGNNLVVDFSNSIINVKIMNQTEDLF